LHQNTEVSEMMNRIEQIADNLKAESRLLADRAVAGLRSAGLETAGLISRTKRPVHVVTDTSLKINNLTHKSIEKLVKQQARMLDDLIDGSVQRLEMASRAKTVKTLVDGQISTLPKSRDHAVSNARKTVALVRDTGESFGDLFKDVVVDISSARPGRKPARKKAASRKPAARKTAAKKRTTKKAPAKKATARKAPAKKAA
jgi:phasin family protein